MSSLRVGRRRSAILPTLVIVAVLIVAFAIFTSVWTDRLWYGSFGYGSVFSKMLLTRIGSVRGLRPDHGDAVSSPMPPSPTGCGRGSGAQMPSSPLLERYRELLESRFVWVAGRRRCRRRPVRRRCRQRPRPRHTWPGATRTPFDVTDPQFGLDVGFFVFSYPWWRFVLSFAFAALIFSAIAAAIVHYTMGGLRFSGPRRGGSRAAQAHLSILVGLAVLVKGVELLVRPVRRWRSTAPTGCSPASLHRRPCHGDRQDDPGDHRGHLRAAVLRQCGTAPLDRADHRADPAAAVRDRAGPGLSGRGAVLQRPTR